MEIFSLFRRRVAGQRQKRILRRPDWREQLAWGEQVDYYDAGPVDHDDDDDEDDDDGDDDGDED